MTILNLTCNHCGAPLQVPEKTRFLTCRFCSSQLEVQHSENAVYTEVLQALDQRTSEIARDVGAIKRQNELAQLDREWERERESYLVRGQHGQRNIPSTAGSAFGMVIGVTFGFIWIAVTSSSGAPAIFPLFGVVVIVVVIIGSLVNMQKSVNYQKRHGEYERRREQLQNEDDAR